MKKVEQGAIVTVPRVDPDAGMEASRTELHANKEKMSKWKVHTETHHHDETHGTRGCIPVSCSCTNSTKTTVDKQWSVID